VQEHLVSISGVVAELGAASKGAAPGPSPLQSGATNFLERTSTPALPPDEDGG